jgi:hypothetical protein
LLSADGAAEIRRLGGTVLEQQEFDASCTHVIVERPSRSEKYLAGCAAGKWCGVCGARGMSPVLTCVDRIVKGSFVEASDAAGRWVDEALHEWSRTDAGRACLPSAPPCSLLSADWLVASKQDDCNITGLYEAPRRWRLHRAKSGRPACVRRCLPRQPLSVFRCRFAGRSFLLFVDAEKLDGFRRMLEAGGAAVGVADASGISFNVRAHAAGCRALTGATGV